MERSEVTPLPAPQHPPTASTARVAARNSPRIELRYLQLPQVLLRVFRTAAIAVVMAASAVVLVREAAAL